MHDKPNKPKPRDLIRGKGLTKGLSLEDKGLGHTYATKDNSLLHNGGLNGGR